MDIKVFLTILTAITATYFTFRNQLKLKAFELFLARRQEVLKDIENFVSKLYHIKAEINEQDENLLLDRFMTQRFHEGLILYHKVKGVSFGEVSNVMLDTFLSIINSPPKTRNKDEIYNWIERMLNIVTALYGFSHSQLSTELDSMAFSWIARVKRKFKSRMKTTNEI